MLKLLYACLRVFYKTAFKIEENARNFNGVLESPTLFKHDASALYKKVKGNPRKIIRK